MYRFWVFGILLVAVPAFVGTGLQAQETVKVDKNAAKALYKEGKVLIKKKQYLKAAEKNSQKLTGQTPPFQNHFIARLIVTVKLKSMTKRSASIRSSLPKCPKIRMDISDLQKPTASQNEVLKPSIAINLIW